MAINFKQVGMITYLNADEPLGTTYDEGTRGLNLDTGYKCTLTGGIWKEGWYHMYVDTAGGSENPAGSEAPIQGLSTVMANSVILTHNTNKVRNVVKTGELGFTDQTTITLGMATSLEVDIILTYGIEKILAKVTYFQTRPGVYTHDIRIYGDETYITITDYQELGHFGLHIAARGTWLMEFFLRDVIL